MSRSETTQNIQARQLREELVEKFSGKLSKTEMLKAKTRLERFIRMTLPRARTLWPTDY